jgi:hypothetical protein
MLSGLAFTDARTLALTLNAGFCVHLRANSKSAGAHNALTAEAVRAYGCSHDRRPDNSGFG